MCFLALPHQPPKLSCWNCPICREQGMGPICLEWEEDWWSWEAFRVGVQQDGSGQSKWGSFSKKTAFRGLSLLSRDRPAFNQIVFDTIADNGLVAAVGDWVFKVFSSLNKGWNILRDQQFVGDVGHECVSKETLNQPEKHLCGEI